MVLRKLANIVGAARQQVIVEANITYLSTQTSEKSSVIHLGEFQMKNIDKVTTSPRSVTFKITWMILF